MHQAAARAAADAAINSLPGPLLDSHFHTIEMPHC